MKALVTGASSGIGYEICRCLDKKGYEIIAVARDLDKMNILKKSCQNNVQIIVADLSKKDEVFSVYEKVKDQKIDLLINDAGFGAFGNFQDVDLQKEIDMINVNIVALHILTKLFLKDMIINDEGKILNIASVAAFAPGPLMATYYSTKSYVYRLSEAIKKELSKKKSNVKISVCCPGPVATNFNNVANVKFSIKPRTSEYVAKIAVEKALKGKFLILPGFKEKMSLIGSRISPDRISEEVVYHVQKRKSK